MSDSYRRRTRDDFDAPAPRVGRTPASIVRQERAALEANEQAAEIENAISAIREEKDNRAARKQAATDIRQNTAYLERERRSAESELDTATKQRPKLEGELSGIESDWQTDEKVARKRTWLGLGGPTKAAQDAQARLESHKTNWNAKKAEIDGLDTSVSELTKRRDSLANQAKPYQDATATLDAADFEEREKRLFGVSIPLSAPATPPASTPSLQPSTTPQTPVKPAASPTPSPAPTTTSNSVPSSSLTSSPQVPAWQQMPKSFDKNTWDDADKQAWTALPPEVKRQFITASQKSALQDEILKQRRAILDAKGDVEAFDEQQAGMSPERKEIINAVRGEKPMDFWSALGEELSSRTRAAVVAPYAGIQDVALGLVDTLSHAEAAATGVDPTETTLGLFVGGAKSQTQEWMGDRDDIVVAQILRAGGSSLAFLAAGANPAGIAALGATSAFGSGYREARDMGASPGQAYARAAVAAGLGTTEALPLARMFDRLEKATGGAVGRFIVNSASQAVEEGLQEGGQTLLQDTYDKITGLTDKQWSAIFKDTGHSAVIAAFSGLLFGQFVNYADRVTAKGQISALDQIIEARRLESGKVDLQEATTRAAESLTNSQIESYKGDIELDLKGFDPLNGQTPFSAAEHVAVLLAKQDMLLAVNTAGMDTAKVEAIEAAKTQIETLIEQKSVTPEQISIAAQLGTDTAGVLARSEQEIQESDTLIGAEQSETFSTPADYRARVETRARLANALQSRIDAAAGNVTPEESTEILRNLPVAKEISRYPDAPADPNENGKVNGSSQRQIAMAIARLANGWKLSDAEVNLRSGNLNSPGPIFRQDKKTGRVTIKNPETLRALETESPLLAQAYKDYETRSLLQQVQPGQQAQAPGQKDQAPAAERASDAGRRVQPNVGPVGGETGSVAYSIPIARRGGEGSRTVEFTAPDDATAREMLADGSAFASSPLQPGEVFDPAQVQRLAPAVPASAAAPETSFAPPVSAASAPAGIPEKYRGVIAPLAPFFRQVQVTDQPLGSGGFVFSGGNLILSLPDAEREIRSASGARRKAIEEVVHSITVQAEQEGKINPSAIFDALPEKLQTNLRRAYPEAARAGNANWQMGHEFLRMVIQRKVKFGEDGLLTWTDSGGQLLSEQTSPTLLARLREALSALIEYLGDLALRLRKDGVAAETIAAIEQAEKIVKDAIAEVSKPQAKHESLSTPEDLRGEKISREWTAFAADSQSLGIPRSEMPQIKAEARGALTQFLKARGIEHVQQAILPGELKPTQAEYSQGRVDKARRFEGGDRAILVSSDNYVVDGHHQWLARLHDQPHEAMRVIRLHAPIRELLPQIAQFPSTETSNGATSDEPSQPQQVPPPASEPAPPPQQPGSEAAPAGVTPLPAEETGPEPEGSVPALDEIELARRLSPKEWEAANLPIEELRDFFNGRQLEQAAGAPRISDRSLSRLFEYFEAVGQTDKADLVQDELERRSYEDFIETNEEVSREGLYELLEAVRALGGIPTTDPELQGELDTMREARGAREIGLFRNQAMPLDRLRSSLEDYGFRFDAPSALLDALDTRLSTGKPVYGSNFFDPAGANALFSQSATADERAAAAGQLILALAATAQRPTALTREQQQLVRENLGLAGWAADRYRNIEGLGESFDDILQTARLALSQAALEYNPSRGPFAPFAGRVIINRLNKKYRKELNRSSRQGVSADAPVSPASEESLVDLTAAPPTNPDPDQGGLSILRGLMDRLPPREQQILTGFAQGKDSRTIGREVGLSHEGVRKAAARASLWLRDQLAQKNITSVQDIFPAAPVLASQSSQRDDSAQNMAVGRFWMDVARDDEAFTLGPTPTAKDLRTILDTFAGPAASEIKIEEHRARDGQIFEYMFHDSNGGRIRLDLGSNFPFVDSFRSKGFATPIYQAIYAWAHNNGQVIYPDVSLSRIGELRRTAQMLSSALRFGTTRHLQPASEQELDDWITDDTPEATQHNIGLLARKEAELTLDRLPELRGYRYSEGNFYDDRGTRIHNSLKNRVFRGRIAAVDPEFTEGAGALTLTRALATVAAEEAAGLRDGLYQPPSPQSEPEVSPRADSPAALKGSLYSQSNGGSRTIQRPSAREVGGDRAGYGIESETDTEAGTRAAAIAGNPSLREHDIPRVAVAERFQGISHPPARHWGVRALAWAFLNYGQRPRDRAGNMPLPIYRADFQANPAPYKEAQEIARAIYRDTLAAVDNAYANHPGEAFRILPRTPQVRALFQLPNGDNYIDGSGEISLAPNEPLFSQGSSMDYPALDRLEAQALAETTGQRTIGDPRLAFSMDNEIWMAMDDWRKAQFQTQREAEWQKAAEIMLARDPALVETAVLEKGMSREVLNPVETKAAQMLIARLSAEPRSEATRRKLQALIYAYRETGSAAGHAMTARQDPHRTPAQRWREFFARKIYSLPPTVQRDVAAAPTQRALQARIATLETRLQSAIGKANANERLLVEKELAVARNTATKEAILDADYNERIRPLQEKLAKMGVSIDDILGGQIELRLMGAQIVKDVAAGLDEQERRIISFIQRTRGGTSPEKISQQLSIPLRDVRRVYGEYRERLKAELTRRFQSGINIQDLETGGVERALLSQPEGPSRTPEEAAALAERALGMMAFFRYDQLGRVRTRRTRPTPPPRPDGPEWQRPTGPGLTLPDSRLDLRQPWTGDARGDERYMPPSDRGRLFTEEPAQMPTGEGKTTETGQFDLGERPYDIRGAGETGERSLFRADEQPWTGDVAHRFDPESETDMLHLARTIETLEESTWVDYATEIGIANLLSAPITGITNLTGYGYAAYELTFKRAIEAALNRGRVADAAQAGELRIIAQWLPKSLSRAFANASIAWATESPVFERDVLNDQFEMRLNTQDERRIRAHIPGAAGRVIRIPLRALLAADEFMKTLFGQLNAAAYAYRFAKDRGITGPGLARFIDAQVGGKNTAAWQRAAQDAIRLSFQTPLRDFRQIKADGDWGYLEALMRLISDVANSDTRKMNVFQQAAVFAFKTVAPFIRTPYRLLEEGWKNTLLGSVIDRATLNKEKTVRDPKSGKIINVPDRAKAAAVNATLVNAALWTLALAALGEGDEDDDDKPILITGSRPSDNPDVTTGVRQLAQRTVPAMSIRIGNTVVSYQRLDPFATMIATTVDFLREMKEMGRGKPGQAALAGASGSIMNQLKEKANLRGFSTLGDMLIGKTSPVEGVLQQAASWTVPNVLRNPIRNSDDFFRDTRSQPLTTDAIAYQFLPLPSLAPPAKVDTYGREAERPGNWLTRTFVPGMPGERNEVHPIDAFAERYNVAHPSTKWAPATPPNRVERGGTEREMTAEEYSRFLKLRGRIFTALARETGVLGIAVPSDADREKITQAGTKATREAKRILFGSQ